MSEAAAPAEPGFLDSLRVFAEWCRRRPWDAVLLAGVFGVIFWFYCGYHVFVDGRETTAYWIERCWGPENDLEHGALILPTSLFIVWYHREALRAAPKAPSLAGLFIALGAVLLFVFSVRTLQPRAAVLSLPPLFYGSVRWIWGRQTARLILFPCLFLVFMVPIGFLVSRTVGLQTLTATVAAKLASFFGIAVDADGADLRALDGSFSFEVAGGCSGIRSLVAMTMLSALYVHFTQRALWKKGVIFCCSLFFALAGNFVRIFSVLIVARLINPKLAGGFYHDYSGFVFFPIAVSAMLSFSRLLNRDWAEEPPADVVPGMRPDGRGAVAAARSGSGGVYDY